MSLFLVNHTGSIVRDVFHRGCTGRTRSGCFENDNLAIVGVAWEKTVPLSPQQDDWAIGSKEHVWDDESDTASETSHPREYEDIALTRFPDFDVAFDSDDEEDDEEFIAQQREKYCSPEDHDVAIFLQLAKRMSLSSLLHLLQGQARARNLLPTGYHHYNLHETRDGIAALHEKEAVLPAPLTVLTKFKQFRFAEVSRGQVRCVVHSIESFKGTTDLWWTHEEIDTIRVKIMEAIKFFKLYSPSYQRRVLTLYQGNKSTTDMDRLLKDLGQDSCARGLEYHILGRELRVDGMNSRAAVLAKQYECQHYGEDYHTSSRRLRERAETLSLRPTGFAQRMAQYDHLESLKASMSKW